MGVAAAAAARTAAAQPAGRVTGFDHVALPIDVNEGAQACSVYIGQQMINFHRPVLWQRQSFTLRAPAAKPPCGDLCFVWEGTPDSLKEMLEKAGARIEEGPVARQGGRRKTASSVYVRDPDGNLLEFMIYSPSPGLSR